MSIICRRPVELDDSLSMLGSMHARRNRPASDRPERPSSALQIWLMKHYYFVLRKG